MNGNIFSIVFVLIAILLYNIYTWHVPLPYVEERPDYFGMIYKSKHHKKVLIKSMGHEFDVHYVENNKRKSINPYFPAIHIVANKKCNAWLHLVRTDAKIQKEYVQFIDASKTEFPFYYKQGNQFWDNPHWGYSIFYKPLTFWVGHACAMYVDEEEKTITCLGGISWGYRLVWWWLRPIMIQPTGLTEQDWQNDWSIFAKELPDYNNISEKLRQ